MSCACCYKVTLLECPEAITINGGLAPSTEYWYAITDKFGNIYKGAITTNGSGILVIPAGDFPKGYFMSFSGTFTLKIYLEENNIGVEDAEVLLTLCDFDYACVLFDFGTDEDLGTQIPDCTQMQSPVVEEEICVARPDTFCEAVKSCIGIRTNGAETKFLNETGEFVDINNAGGLTCENISECEAIQNIVSEVDAVSDDLAQEILNRESADSALQDAINDAQDDINAHESRTDNPHNVTAAQVGAPNGSGTSTGTNNGDETNSSIKTKLGAATASNDGYLTAADWIIFSNQSKHTLVAAFSGAASVTLTTIGTKYLLQGLLIPGGTFANGDIMYLKAKAAKVVSGSTVRSIFLNLDTSLGTGGSQIGTFTSSSSGSHYLVPIERSLGITSTGVNGLDPAISAVTDMANVVSTNIISATAVDFSTDKYLNVLASSTSPSVAITIYQIEIWRYRP